MKVSAFDQFTASFAPKWTVKRLRARQAFELLKRHYEAASRSRRTENWNRSRGTANAVMAVALAELRIHARDLIRNNAWAKRGSRVLANHTVGWGIVPKAVGGSTEATDLWRSWAESTESDPERRMTFYGLQHLAVRTLASDGEFLIRRRPRRETDGLTIPLQLQLLDIDFLDTGKNGEVGKAGGPIKMGVEFDKLGRRAAYWLFDSDPATGEIAGNTSRAIPASEIAHVFDPDRPHQSRGPSWLGASIVPMKELDEFEDATQVRQKIAACFAAFTEDDGSGTAIAEQSATDPLVETFEPGMIAHLPPGKKISFATPPGITDDGFTTRNLRKIAAGIGVTYEDMTGDYSQVNFSSARMGRLSHWGNVHAWQYHMLIPQLCDTVWRWAMEAAFPLENAPLAEWTTPPMPMIEPDKEGLAYQRLVRNGVMTPSAVIREQGGDPAAFFEEYAADMKRLKELGIQLDTDVSAVSQAGLTQVRSGAGGGDSPPNNEAQRALEEEVDPEVAKAAMHALRSVQ